MEPNFWRQEKDGSHCLQQTTDGGYIITGWTHSYGLGDGDIWLIKTDSNGNKVWNQTFGGSKHDDGISVQQTMDRGYIITGYTRSLGAGDWDAFLIKTDSNGKEEWIKTFGGIHIDSGPSVQQTTDGGYVITGATNSHSGGTHDDIWLIKIAIDITGMNHNSKRSHQCFILEQNYPNPFNITTCILYSIPRSDFMKLIVYDVLGRQIHTLVDEFQDSGTYSINFNASKFSSGVYFYMPKTCEYLETKKLLLLQ